MDCHRHEIAYLYIVVKLISQGSLKIKLDIPPLDILIKNIAAKFVPRLKESRKMGHEHVGHVSVLGAMIGSIMVQGTDYLLKILNFSKAFKTRNPSTEERRQIRF